ncbi:phosphatidylglycerophosphatase A family protein [Paraneptunicella aestuarii]|uniref:phosphatidylglycerophosphatase A family protein n=1 Tax=Paraneptunicella aestuarii TaxID=2831148 RepID=UPI001E59F1BB|nr:phosphatidylglycerophosphatase A [Paraneptunicella aestuarii]
MPEKNTLSTRELFRKIKFYHPAHWLAFGFGSGLLPKAPGTFGSLAAIPLVYWASMLPTPVYSLLLTPIILIGIWVCKKAAEDLGVHDHPAIVWDEIAGMMITFMAVPFTLPNLIVGFILFRALDIFKPWPIRWADQSIDGGLGIMLDDVMAGVIASGILQAALYFGVLA